MSEHGAEDGIVDWTRTGRRVRTTAAVVAVVVVVAWLVTGLVGDGIRLADLGDWVGLGLGVVVVGEVLVVGTAAVRAERRAAVRGERLGSDDIGLLPPRIPRPSSFLGGQDDGPNEPGDDDEPEN